MALVHINSLITTTPRLLVKIPTGVQQTAIQIFNNTGATIYVGDTSVGTSGATVGNAIATAASVQIWLQAGDELYAVCATNPAGYVSVIYSA
jgi:hypothetical protein